MTKQREVVGWLAYLVLQGLREADGGFFEAVFEFVNALLHGVDRLLSLFQGLTESAALSLELVDAGDDSHDALGHLQLLERIGWQGSQELLGDGGVFLHHGKKNIGCGIRRGRPRGGRKREQWRWRFSSAESSERKRWRWRFWSAESSSVFLCMYFLVLVQF